MAEGDLLVEENPNLKFNGNVDGSAPEEEEPNFDDPEDFVDDVDDEGMIL